MIDYNVKAKNSYDELKVIVTKMSTSDEFSSTSKETLLSALLWQIKSMLIRLALLNGVKNREKMTFFNFFE